MTDLNDLKSQTCYFFIETNNLKVFQVYNVTNLFNFNLITSVVKKQYI